MKSIDHLTISSPFNKQQTPKMHFLSPPLHCYHSNKSLKSLSRRSKDSSNTLNSSPSIHKSVTLGLSQSLSGKARVGRKKRWMRMLRWFLWCSICLIYLGWFYWTDSLWEKCNFFVGCPRSSAYSEIRGEQRDTLLALSWKGGSKLISILCFLFWNLNRRWAAGKTYYFLKFQAKTSMFIFSWVFGSCLRWLVGRRWKWWELLIILLILNKKRQEGELNLLYE